MRSLSELNAKGKVVFYRTDYNVPLKDGVIQDDYRIQVTLPTLELLMKKGAKIVIGTHLGRPEGKRQAQFELRPVAEYLADLFPQQTVRLAHKIHAAEVEQALAEMQPGDILLLPNLRFYKGEEANKTEFAAELAVLADTYVNDAFACDHRAHASIVGVPQLIPGYPGLWLQKELTNLTTLLEKPAHPLVIVMGGAKVSDKIKVIHNLAEQADHILVGGAMANTFLLAKGIPVGDSVVEKDKVKVAQQLMDKLGEKLVLAADYIKDEDNDKHYRYLDIGDQAVADFKEYLKDAKTIFWNGSLGYTEEPDFAQASEEIARFITSLKGVTTVVAGGDTVELISQLKLREEFTFVSSGGGAALEFLAGKTLPGVEVLEEKPQELEEMQKEKVEETKISPPESQSETRG